VLRAESGLGSISGGSWPRENLQSWAEGEGGNEAAKLQELEEMAAELWATARKLPSGQDRHKRFRRSEDFGRG